MKQCTYSKIELETTRLFTVLSTVFSPSVVVEQSRPVSITTTTSTTIPTIGGPISRTRKYQPEEGKDYLHSATTKTDARKVDSLSSYDDTTTSTAKKHHHTTNNNNFPLRSFSLHQIFQSQCKLFQQDDNDKSTPSSCCDGSSRRMGKNLHDALSEQGAILLTCPVQSQPGDILTRLQHHVQETDQLFPHEAQRMTSNTIYVSERDVPMYRLGYEKTEDQIREIVRIPGGLNPDEVTFLSNEQRSLWLQSLALLRHVTDAVLDLLLSYDHDRRQIGSCPTVASASFERKNQNPSRVVVKRMPRPYSNAPSWCKRTTDKTTGRLAPYFERDVGSFQDRPGDFSILYAMHYFNETYLSEEEEEEQPQEESKENRRSSDNKSNHIHDKDKVTKPKSIPIAVKEHVDPSLCIVEPFLWPYSQGLQVWCNNEWLDCDGPHCSLHQQQQPTNAETTTTTTTTDCCQLLLFAGKALQEAVHLPAATKHRVVQGDGPRKTVIYEQKYAEFFEPNDSSNNTR